MISRGYSWRRRRDSHQFFAQPIEISRIRWRRHSGRLTGSGVSLSGGVPSIINRSSRDRDDRVSESLREDPRSAPRSTKLVRLTDCLLVHPRRELALSAARRFAVRRSGKQVDPASPCCGRPPDRTDDRVRDADVAQWLELQPSKLNTRARFPSPAREAPGLSTRAPAREGQVAHTCALGDTS